jgi:hypothetical protein
VLYSTNSFQHRSYLRLASQPFTSLPADITIQTLVSLLLAIYACSVIAGDFQQIRIDQQVGEIDFNVSEFVVSCVDYLHATLFIILFFRRKRNLGI